MIVVEFLVFGYRQCSICCPSRVNVVFGFSLLFLLASDGEVQ
jgi:hypothetical protein